MDDYKTMSAALALREDLRGWLAATHTVMASGDASFSDDGEQAKAQTSPAENPHRDVSDLKPAAVLVLLINDVEPKVLFTQRTAHLTDHAGQISFPGGRVEASDRDAVHTALRETTEETGVDSSAIEIIGTLPFYTTGTGYLITPVVGWIDGPLVYTPDPKEVAECFEVPFHFLIDPRNHRLETAMYKGRMRSYYAVPYDNRYIWGATAGMLVTLTRVVAHARGESYQPAVEWKNDSGR